MNTLKLKLISLIFLSVFLSSCTNLLYTSLDVLRPAKVAFNPNANNLLIVNNAVVQPVEYGHTTQLINTKPKKVLVSADSLGIFCISSLTEEMQSKAFFLNVNFLLETINNSGDFNTNQLLTSEKVKQLCLENNSNVVLSLDNIKVYDDLSEYFDSQQNSFLASLEVKVETDWSVHYINSSKLTSVQFVDTVYWEAESYKRKNTMSQLPLRYDALIDAAITAGKKSIDRFVPRWEKVDRYFYNPGNKLMREAMDSVYVKNWKSAIDLWVSAYDSSKSKRIKSQAANNIAIAYEIIGDIDKAFEYATISYYMLDQLNLYDYESYVRTMEYVNDLSQRKKEIDILKDQLGEK